jgi:hypothetical protein
VLPTSRRALLQGEFIDEIADARELPKQGILLGIQVHLEEEATGDLPQTLKVDLRKRSI